MTLKWPSPSVVKEVITFSPCFTSKVIFASGMVEGTPSRTGPPWLGPAVIVPSIPVVWSAPGEALSPAMLATGKSAPRATSNKSFLFMVPADERKSHTSGKARFPNATRADLISNPALQFPDAQSGKNQPLGSGHRPNGGQGFILRWGVVRGRGPAFWFPFRSALRAAPAAWAFHSTKNVFARCAWFHKSIFPGSALIDASFSSICSWLGCTPAGQNLGAFFYNPVTGMYQMREILRFAPVITALQSRIPSFSSHTRSAAATSWRVRPNGPSKPPNCFEDNLSGRRRRPPERRGRPPVERCSPFTELGRPLRSLLVVSMPPSG